MVTINCSLEDKGNDLNDEFCMENLSHLPCCNGLLVATFKQMTNVLVVNKLSVFNKYLN